MNKKFLPHLLILLLILTLTTTSTAVYAAGADTAPTDLSACADWPKAPDVESPCAILMEAKTGDILYAKDMDTPNYPASITKIMTGLLVLENCSLEDTLTFSYRATHELEAGSTHIARTEGEQMSVKDCMYALLLASANEVAQGLAEHVSGNIEDFAALMTQRAKDLGCTNTNFTNPSGLNDENHYTSCRDMAIITRAAIANPDFLAIDSTLTYTIPKTNKHDEPLPIANKHQLVKDGPNHYDGATGGKTGYTTLAGNTLVTYAMRSDMELICVVMKSNGTHYEDTVTLLDYGFNNFAMHRLSETASLDITDADGQAVALPENTTIPEDEWILLPKDMELASLDTNVESQSGEPDANGLQAVAKVHYSHKGTELGSALLMAPAAVTEQPAETTAATSTEAEKPSLGQRVRNLFGKIRPLEWLKALQIFVQKHILIVAVILVILVVLFILWFRSFRKKRRRRKGYNSYSMGRRRRISRRRRKGPKYKMKL